MCLLLTCQDTFHGCAVKINACWANMYTTNIFSTQTWVPVFERLALLGTFWDFFLGTLNGNLAGILFKLHIDIHVLMCVSVNISTANCTYPRKGRVHLCFGHVVRLLRTMPSPHNNPTRMYCTPTHPKPTPKSKKWQQSQAYSNSQPKHLQKIKKWINVYNLRINKKSEHHSDKMN